MCASEKTVNPQAVLYSETPSCRTATKMADADNYRQPAVSNPQLEDVRALNDELKLKCTEQQLKEMTELLNDGLARAFQRVSEMLDTAVPVVKYPRTPGYKPAPEDNPYNAWAWRCDVNGSATGKLSGRTVAIKDNTAVAGVPMRNGTKVLDNYIPEFDATVVTRILDAGGRITGKSSVEDMCYSGSSVTCCDGPVRNPNDQTRIAGGSSSGSAALVAGGIVDMATGGDQAGSIRIPSSFCGIVGLKPTWGLVPYTGAASIEPTVDHLGPMAKTVADCALLLEVIAGYDEGRDPRQPPTVTVPEYSKLIDAGVAGKRIGLLMEGFDSCHEDFVSTVVREAANKLTEAGCKLKEVSIPMHKDAADLWAVSAGYGAIKTMIDFNGAGALMKGFYSTSMIQATLRGRYAHPQDLHPFIKMNTIAMTHFDRLYGNRLYGKAMNLIMELGKKYDEVLKDFDVLIMPTLTYIATKIPPRNCSLKELENNCMTMVENTMPFNSTGHPALTINAGFSPSDEAGGGGLPIGMMIVGRKFDEVTILQVARAFEQLST